MNAVVSAARRGWRGDPSGKGCGYTKAGVILDDLLPEADRPRDARLMDGLDAINNRLGKKTLGWLVKASPVNGLHVDHRSPATPPASMELPPVQM